MHEGIVVAGHGDEERARCREEVVQSRVQERVVDGQVDEVADRPDDAELAELLPVVDRAKGRPRAPAGRGNRGEWRIASSEWATNCSQRRMADSEWKAIAAARFAAPYSPPGDAGIALHKKEGRRNGDLLPCLWPHRSKALPDRLGGLGGHPSDVE